MEVDGGAAVAGDDVDFVTWSDRTGGAGKLDFDVLLGLADERSAFDVSDGLDAHVVRHRFQTGVGYS